MRHLHFATRFDASIAGLTRLFDGRGKAVGSMWQISRVALDGFGRERPLRAHVMPAAQRFGAWLTRFTPLCRLAVRQL